MTKLKTRGGMFTLLTCAMVGVLSTACSAADAGPAEKAVNSGDTAWLLISTALVMLMTPGLAFFYGGLVRRKNVLSVLMQCFMILCLVSIQWVVCGYSLAFGPDAGHGLIGTLDWAFLRGVGQSGSSVYAATAPHEAFMIFQMMFAVITPALIIGAFAERMRFLPFCIFSLLWATLVYDPIAHWVWGQGGMLGTMGGAGALDFAGGIVVHISAGVAALAAALVLGRRVGSPHRISPPHSLPFAALGAGLLWFGWFGFNAGSALTASGLAASALVATHVAGAMAGLTWALLDWIMYRKPTTLGMITGAVGGLAAVTPASGYVTVGGALAIGVGAGIFPWLAVTFLKTRLRYDDSLDAFGVHGVGGIWGVLATGLFASKLVNPAGADGVVNGNVSQLWIQLKAIGITGAYAFVGSLLLLKLVDIVLGLRASEHEERVGLDLTQHKEVGYTLID